MVSAGITYAADLDLRPMIISLDIMLLDRFKGNLAPPRWATIMCQGQVWLLPMSAESRL